MRRLCLLSLLLILSACAALKPLPKPDPNQAWIGLYHEGKGKLEATRADRKALDDWRYFQVWPGNHEVEVRYQFEVQPSNIGGQAKAPFARTCLLSLEYPKFAAGERYGLETGHVGWQPWVRLVDEHGQEVARSAAGRCGEV